MQDRPLEKGIYELILYSGHLEIRGTLEASPPRRLVDILNDPNRPLLALKRASILPLSGRAGSVPTSAPELTVRKEEIIVAWLVRESQVQSSDALLTVHKVHRPVIAYAEDFLIHGQYYMISENTLHQTLDTLHDDFFALTQPSLESVTHPDIVLKEGLLAAIQRRRLTAMHLEQISSSG